jgi:hypothetical protein
MERVTFERSVSVDETKDFPEAGCEGNKQFA